MPDLSVISTVLTSVKTATDLAKLIKNSQSTLEGAETKLKLAELISTLADVKLELANVQDTLREKDEKIRELGNQIAKKLSMKFDGKIYWQEGDKTPFCTVCYEKDYKNHHLSYQSADEWTSANYWCQVCEKSYYL